MMKRYSAALAIVALAFGSANGQSINVSFGHASGGPSSSYAAAGAGGVWNSITGIAGSSFNLVAIDGSPSGVSVSQSPTTTVLMTADPSVSGDDASLLNSGLVTNGAETCLSFGGFKPGTYEVLIYAWLPNQPTVKSRTRQDQAPSTIDVGGAWSGAHAEGVTYARYVVTVDSSGNLPAHSGLVPGAPQSALNAVQIRPLSSVPPDGGTMSVPDLGVSSNRDGGGTPASVPPDGGTMSVPDLSVSSNRDGGRTPASDAGPTPGDDAGLPGSDLAPFPSGNPSDGAPAGPAQKAGCSFAGGDVGPFAIVALALAIALLRRRRRRGSSVALELARLR
jgi:MYXO-CTERM domain-containing protein